MFKFFNRKTKAKIAFVVFTLGVSSVTSAYSDPTRPPGFGGQQAKRIKFSVSSILVSDDRKVAVINGQVVSEGDRVSGAKVLSISKSAVKINQRGKILELKPKRVSIRREK